MGALAWVGGATVDSERLAQTREVAASAPLPSVAVQTAAFLAMAGLEPGPEARSRAREVLRTVPVEALGQNQGVLTWRERAEALEVEVVVR